MAIPKNSTKNAPLPGGSAVRQAGDVLKVKVHIVRPGVLGIDPEIEAPDVPNFTTSVNAKPLDASPSERGTGRS